MKDIKKVMACVDLSDYSTMTVEYTLEFLRGLKAEILLFNVINNRDIESLETVSPHFSKEFNVDSYVSRVKAERLQIIHEMIEKHFKKDKEQLKVLIHVGIPFDAILRAIETEKIDLVIIASKGKSTLLGTLVGSNAEKVFRHSPVPVLSVRSRERFSKNR